MMCISEIYDNSSVPFSIYDNGSAHSRMLQNIYMYSVRYTHSQSCLAHRQHSFGAFSGDRSGCLAIPCRQWLSICQCLYKRQRRGRDSTRRCWIVPATNVLLTSDVRQTITVRTSRSGNLSRTKIPWPRRCRAIVLQGYRELIIAIDNCQRVTFLVPVCHKRQSR